MYKTVTAHNTNAMDGQYFVAETGVVVGVVAWVAGCWVAYNNATEIENGYTSYTKAVAYVCGGTPGRLVVA